MGYLERRPAQDRPKSPLTTVAGKERPFNPRLPQVRDSLLFVHRGADTASALVGASLTRCEVRSAVSPSQRPDTHIVAPIP